MPLPSLRGALRPILREHYIRIRRRINQRRKDLVAFGDDQRQEILTFCGWASITTGVAFVPWFNPWAVWAVSAGFFALSLVGFQPLRLIVTRGLVALERSPRREQLDE